MSEEWLKKRLAALRSENRLLRREHLEQARLLDMSAEREAKHLAQLDSAAKLIVKLAVREIALRRRLG